MIDALSHIIFISGPVTHFEMGAYLRCIFFYISLSVTIFLVNRSFLCVIIIFRRMGNFNTACSIETI